MPLGISPLQFKNCHFAGDSTRFTCILFIKYLEFLKKALNYVYTLVFHLFINLDSFSPKHSTWGKCPLTITRIVTFFFLLARGHRVLLFSQMTHMLDILQDYMDYRGDSPRPLCPLNHVYVTVIRGMGVTQRKWCHTLFRISSRGDVWSKPCSMWRCVSGSQQLRWHWLCGLWSWILGRCGQVLVYNRQVSVAVTRVLKHWFQ